MGQVSSCCGIKRHQLSETIAKTPNGFIIDKKKNECYETDQFLKSEDELHHEGLICAICLGVVRDAVKDPCGHVFGQKCIQNWLEKTQKCPYSQHHLTKASLKVDKETQFKVKIELQKKEELNETQQRTHIPGEQVEQQEQHGNMELENTQQREMSVQVVQIRSS